MKSIDKPLQNIMAKLQTEKTQITKKETQGLELELYAPCWQKYFFYNIVFIVFAGVVVVITGIDIDHHHSLTPYVLMLVTIFAAFMIGILFILFTKVRLLITPEQLQIEKFVFNKRYASRRYSPQDILKIKKKVVFKQKRRPPVYGIFIETTQKNVTLGEGLNKEEKDNLIELLNFWKEHSITLQSINDLEVSEAFTAKPVGVLKRLSTILPIIGFSICAAATFVLLYTPIPEFQELSPVIGQPVLVGDSNHVDSEQRKRIKFYLKLEDNKFLFHFRDIPAKLDREKYQNYISFFKQKEIKIWIRNDEYQHLQEGETKETFLFGMLPSDSCYIWQIASDEQTLLSYDETIKKVEGYNQDVIYFTLLLAVAGILLSIVLSLEIRISRRKYSYGIVAFKLLFDLMALVALTAAALIAFWMAGIALSNFFVCDYLYASKAMSQNMIILAFVVILAFAIASTKNFSPETHDENRSFSENTSRRSQMTEEERRTTLFIMSGVLVLTLVFTGIGLYGVIESYLVLSWPSVEGEIVSSTIQMQKLRTGQIFHYITIKFVYVVEGQNYQRQKYTSVEGSKTMAENVVKKNYFNGKKITFLYDPFNPNRNSFEFNYSVGMFFSSLAFVILGSGGFIVGLWTMISLYRSK